MSDDAVVYIVDDHSGVRIATTALLESAGFNVRSFGSAEEFLGLFEPEQTGCLLLDVRLPGMSGLELQRKLRLVANNLPVILISGHASEKAYKEGKVNGALAFLQKPVNSNQLIETIKEALVASKKGLEK